MGTHTKCANHPRGRSGFWVLTPFPDPGSTPFLKSDKALGKRARLWNSAELFVLVLVLVLSEAVLAIEMDGKSRAN